MLLSARSRLRSASTIAVLAVTAAFVAACASPQPKAMHSPKKRSKEYFAESEYGVKASPRVAYGKSNLRRGGGRDQVGKPYKVRGKMYYPKEDKNYRKTGTASWYGDAFHGRLTANGEVYDMTHLSAAHPTMPLPSYARVTNMANGSSVIVRVNDRGPYSHGRLIDLSKRAAEMLDYTHHGTAKVRVEYVGRAPLHGRDDSYLMASYRPGKGGRSAPDPVSDGLPEGVMIAMNGPTPSAVVGQVASAQAFPGTMVDAAPASPVGFAEPVSVAAAPGDVVLPALGPIAPERPGFDLPPDSPFAVASLSYAPTARNGADEAFSALQAGGLTPEAVLQSWKRMRPGAESPEAVPAPYVAAGSFTSAAEADALAAALSPLGRVEVSRTQADGTDWYSVDLYGNGGRPIDGLIEAAWAKGASDAIAVRD